MPPTRHLTVYDTVLIFPPKLNITFKFSLDTALSLAVWQDTKAMPVANLKHIKCDLCGRFMPLSGANLNHRAQRAPWKANVDHDFPQRGSGGAHTLANASRRRS